MPTEPIPYGTRENDTVSLRVTRSVPVWSIVTGLVFVVGQAVALQLGQQRLGELITVQNLAVNEIKTSLVKLTEDLSVMRLDVFKHEMTQKEIERRLNALEHTDQIANRKK